MADVLESRWLATHKLQKRKSGVPMESFYDDEGFIVGNVAQGNHRAIVGGLWDEIGTLQFEFLKAQGLLPEHRLLDVGCGSLRGGIHFIRYLNKDNYFGFDRNDSLFRAGYEIELTQAGLSEKLSPSNLRQQMARFTRV